MASSSISLSMVGLVFGGRLVGGSGLVDRLWLVGPDGGLVGGVVGQGHGGQGGEAKELER